MISLWNLLSLCPPFSVLKLFSMLDRHASEPPMLQVAFQYTVIVPPEELSSSGLSSASRYGLAT